MRATVKRLHMTVLRTVIQDTRGKLAKLEHELYQLHLKLAALLPPEEWEQLYVMSTHYAESAAVQQKEAHRKKLEKLCPVKKAPICELTPQHAKLLENDKVVNLSQINLSDCEIRTLELGLNFAVSKPVNELETVCSIERALHFSKLEVGQKDYLRSNISKVLLNNRNYIPNLNIDEQKCLHALRSRSDIVITKADKGGSIVILDKSQYTEGLNDILVSGSYKVTKNSVVNKSFDSFKSVVLASPFIDDAKKRALIPSNWHAGRMYALPKIHKPQLAFRPIVSSIGTPTHQLAKFLTSKLAHLKSTNTYSLENSLEFVSSLRELNSDGLIMVSFDIVSLFTKVPVPGALSALEKKLFEIHTPPEDVTAILKLVSACVENTTFTVEQKLYCQTTGLPMGGPLSPILCDTYLHYIETTIMEKAPHLISWWRRYVDDIFALLRGTRNDAQGLLQLLNSLDSDIQFTVEYEENGTLPFLDVLVTRNATKFETEVYRKPFSVQLPPHVRSCHVFSQKATAWYTFVRRAQDLCSTPDKLHNELNFLRHVAYDRGFDPVIIDKAVYKFNAWKPSTNLVPIEDERKPFALIPTNSASSQIGNILRKKFKTVFTPSNKFSDSFHAPKDCTAPLHRSGIYHIPCSCNLGYIGQTRRKLRERVRDHKRYVANHEVDKSNIAKHSWDADHCFKFNDAKIIKVAHSPMDLNILEAFLITKFKKELVNDNHHPPISPIWREVIKIARVKEL